MNSGICRPYWGLLLTISIVSGLAGCGESTDSSGGGTRLQPVLPTEATATASSLTYEAARDMFEVHRDQMKSERIVRGEAWGFIEDALMHEDFEVQRIGADLLREVLKVEPSQADRIEAMLRQQVTLSLPEDKLFWQAVVDELFPSKTTEGTASSGATGNTPSDEARDPQAPTPSSLRQSAPPAEARTDRAAPSRPGQ